MMLGVLALTLSRPAWALSADEIVNTTLSLIEMSGYVKHDDVEMAKFTVKHPDCSATIMEETVKQDYACIGTVIALKGVRASKYAIPGLGKVFDEGTCRQLNALQQLYAFLDRTGDKFLSGSPLNSSYLKNLAKQQLAQGKTQAEGELASVPVAGPILLNWDCLCQAAFETNLTGDQVAQDMIKLTVEIIHVAQSGDIGGLVEDVIRDFGPKIACQLAADLSGANDIPVVGPATVSTCTSILGKPLRWAVMAGKEVIEGAGSVAKKVWYDAGQALGLNDPKAMPQETYYDLYWRPWYQRGVWLCLKSPNCKYKGESLGDVEKIVRDPCEDYFADHDMTRSTAQDACDSMRDKRYNPAVKAIAKAMPKAADAFFENAVRPLVRDFALGSYGKPLGAEIPGQTFSHKLCVSELRKRFSFPEEPMPAKQTRQIPSPIAVDVACDTMNGKYSQAYQSDSIAIANAATNLQKIGCRIPQGWKVAAKGLMYECDTYAAYAQCRTALEPGVLVKHCRPSAVADKKLAEEIISQLTSVRCQMNGTTVTCTRPWKESECKMMVKNAAAISHLQPKVTCPSNTIADIAYAVKLKQAKDVVTILNGGSLQPARVARPAPAAPRPANPEHCVQTWDPLAIECKFDATYAAAKSRLPPGFTAKSCPQSDPEKNGSDDVCFVYHFTPPKPAGKFGY